MPERYQEMLTRASELGNNRIAAGMHSCLDVMGGRVMSTAIAASVLNNPEYAKLKEKAKADGYGDSKFSKVTINGLDKDSKAKVVYGKEGLVLTDEESLGDKDTSNDAAAADGNDINNKDAFK